MARRKKTENGVSRGQGEVKQVRQRSNPNGQRQSGRKNGSVRQLPPKEGSRQNKPARQPGRPVSSDRPRAVREEARRPAPKKQRQRAGSHRGLMLITFTLLFVYLAGYLLAFLNKPSIGVEKVAYGTIDVPAVYKGLIVRDEVVVQSDRTGQPVYNYPENERVKRNALICSIKNVETTKIIEDEIEKIDRDILKTQRNRSDLSIFKEDISLIESRIDNAVASYTYKFIGNKISDVYGLRTQVENQLNKRNEIWLLENTDSLSALTEEKSQYEAQLADNISSIRTEYSGILSLYVDGFEDKLTPDTLDSITEEQLKMEIVPELISKSKAIEAGQPAFKIVRSNIWYIAAYVPNEAAKDWVVGDVKVINTSTGDEDVEVQMTIERLDVGSSKTYCVFRTDKSAVDFLGLRTVDFTVSGDIYKGIKIPNAAIVEKTLLKIPATCVQESLGEKGVMKRVTGQGDIFVNIVISARDEGTDTGEGYYYVLQDFDNLRLGDVILQGTGENAVPYTISEVSTQQGVYVVNSSVAKFTVIDIVGQNNNYAIVKTDESGYTLKVYDSIVSDAKNVNASDVIY